jgi:anti-sigma regulatory factor (Ser/Thr protein kinase)
MLQAIEYARRFQPDQPLTVRVLASSKAVLAFLADQAPEPFPASQSLGEAAKIIGQLPSQGWGFFLIEKKMIDEFQVSPDEAHHTIELFLYPENMNTGEVG